MAHTAARGRFRKHLSVWCVAICLLAGAAPRASAQDADGWEVNLAPLYFWASSMSGSMLVAQKSVPVFLDFGTAASNLSGVFTFQGDARRGRFGVLGDIGFVRLGTDATFTLQGPAAKAVSGHLEMDNVIAEVGGSAYLARRISVIGGVRTYTLSPRIQFTGTVAAGLPIVDVTKTNVDGFGGVVFRPQLSPNWWLSTRADLGAGQSTFTWSTSAIVEYRFKPFAGVAFGFKALGIDTGETTLGSQQLATSVPTHFKVTHYGPLVSGTFHWGR